jgi:tRNA1(Val) A37 N6-methylase TrmN6
MERKYLLENKYSLENIILIISIDLHRRIIELGAGSGLLGLALLKYSEEILSYTFTDYSPMILNLLRENGLLNFSEDQLDVIK